MTDSTRTLSGIGERERTNDAHYSMCGSDFRHSTVPRDGVIRLLLLLLVLLLLVKSETNADAHSFARDFRAQVII